MPITIYEKGFELCDVRTMSRGDIIAILTYIYELENSELKSCVVDNFIDLLCFAENTMKAGLTETLIPKMVYTFDKYIATFTAGIENGGVYLSLTYDSSLGNNDDSNNGDEPQFPPYGGADNGNRPLPMLREPFYASPYERFYWYDKYAWPGYFFWPYPKNIFNNNDSENEDVDTENPSTPDDNQNENQEDVEVNPLEGVYYNYFISETMLFDDMDICLV